jgi:hypothetical protein
VYYEEANVEPVSTSAEELLRKAGETPIVRLPLTSFYCGTHSGAEIKGEPIWVLMERGKWAPDTSDMWCDDGFELCNNILIKVEI